LGKSIVIDAGGRIVVGGSSWPVNAEGQRPREFLAVWRLTENGALDRTLHGTGFLAVPDTRGNALALDSEGRIGSGFAPDRPRSAKAPILPTPWRGRFSDYRLHNDMWLPFAGEVAWEIAGKDVVYWQGRIELWK